ncbi:MAG: fluoride efflux transporter CrcB [Lysobacteraceae bacterium]
MATVGLWWQQLLLVMCGGALGAGMRFWMGGALLRAFGERLPWGTLTANLVGSFAAGFLAVWLEGRGQSALYWRAFLIVGVLGALTTYSALMLDCLIFSRSSRSEVALLYLVITLILGLLLVWCGARSAQWLRPF